MVHSTTLSWLQKGHLNTLSRVVFFLMTIFFVLFFRRPMVARGFLVLLRSLVVPGSQAISADSRCACRPTYQSVGETASGFTTRDCKLDGLGTIEREISH